MHKTIPFRNAPALVLVALSAALLMVVALVTLPVVGKWHTGDLLLYFNDSRKLLGGQLPYRDFAIEYPPLALAPFALPWLLAPGSHLLFTDYVALFLLENTFFSVLIGLVVLALSGPRDALPTLVIYAALVGVGAPLLPWRYDLFPALLTALALLSVARARPMWAGVWLGLGVAAKLYPIVLLPICGLFYLAQGNRRGLARLALGGVVGALAPTLPFVLAAPRQIGSFVTYHQLRGLQLESLPAGAIVLAHVLGLTAAKLEFNYGALHLVSPASAAALRWLPMAFVGLFALVCAAAWQSFRQQPRTTPGERPSEGAIETLVVYATAALLAFIITNKVFSPQYLIWLLPFAPLLRRRHALLIILIAALTTLLFPFDYGNLIKMRRLPVLLLNLRNALALLLLGWMLFERAPAWVRMRLAAAPWRNAARSS